jgi:hypothetical protein
MRTLTIKEYLLEELNRRARERGEDIELVFERPTPRLATKEGAVVEFRRADQTEEKVDA